MSPVYSMPRSYWSEKKYGRSCVDRIFSEHCLGGGGALASGIRPVLDTQMSTQPRVVGVGDVAGGEDVFIGGAEVLIDDDPVVHGEAGGCGEVAVGGDPHPDEDHVGGDLGSVAQHDCGDGAVPAGQFGHRDLAAQVHAMVTMKVREDGCGLGSEDAQ